MMNRIRLILAVALLPMAALAADIHVPEELRDWQPWVLEGEEHRDCPFYFDRDATNKGHFICSWPGDLRLDVDEQGGRFSQSWTVYADSQWLQVPGDASYWPHEVSVNGRAAEVVARNGMPSVRLEPGAWRIAGRFEWDQRPGVLRLPERSGLVSLTVDGVAVERPDISRGGIYLGERKQETQARDAVTTQVYRLVHDEVPTRLATVIKIDVSGGVREELFGPILPEDFVPLALDSDLPARLEADGKLRVQVRPGRWQLTLQARAPGVLDTIALQEPQVNLPASEIWSYRSNEALRVTAAEGLPPVDPVQVRAPEQWLNLPAFRIQPGQSLEITERSRGIVGADNQLILERTMWLDYDGGGFVVADAVSGTMRTGWRLDMAAPFRLLSASEFGDDLLITKGASEDLSGVEVRQTEVGVESIARSETRKAMSVTGWQERFTAVDTELNLPPGHKLLAAPGADNASGSWASQWRLLDYFLVLIVTIATWKLFGPVPGLIALFGLTLSYHESGTLAWLWLNLLVAVALIRVAPDGRLKQSLKVYQGLSVLVLLATLVPFMANQLRIAIYPQLEPQYQVFYDREQVPLDAVRIQQAPPRVARESATMQMEADALEEVVVSAAKAPRTYSRYAPNAIVQAGPGMPTWQWNTYYLSWSGPIDADQSVRLVILPSWFVTFARFLQVGLLLGFSAVLAAEIFGRRLKLPTSAGNRTATAIVIAFAGGMLSLASPVVEAQTPDPDILQELKTRLLQPPDCVPRCAEIASAEVTANADTVTIAMSIHALEAVALPLPGSLAGWRPEAVVVDGTAANKVLRGPRQLLWLLIEPGRHSVTLRGTAPAVDSLEIPFPTPPRFVRASSDHWLISGVKDRRLLSGSLQLTRLQTEQGDDSARWESSRFPPFVLIDRSIELDLDWQATTTVTRVAPRQGAITLDLPLIDGESVLTDNMTAENGRILVSMAPDQRTVTWRSNLPRTSPLSLISESEGTWKERWRIVVGRIWNAEFSGVPESETGIYTSDVRIATFHPRAGESLTMHATRPGAVEGSTLAFDGVRLATQLGNRSRDVQLKLDYRSTRGSQHVVDLPADAEVTAVSVDGEVQPLRAEDGQLTLPILPGEHSVQVEWRESGAIATRSKTSAVDIGAPSSNIELGMALPADRWVLATRGPKLGPAVLYWSELAVLILAALILGRVKLTPLKTVHWLLLGLGFSMFSWPALAWVVLWLLACGARERWSGDTSWWRFNLVQAGVVLITLIAIGSIISSLPMGLLGSPDMHVAGHGSFGNSLNWFADRSDSLLPQASVFSVPMWIYKVLILGWALWLSFALLRWLPWVWRCFSSDGYWRSRKA